LIALAAALALCAAACSRSTTSGNVGAAPPAATFDRSTPYRFTATERSRDGGEHAFIEPITHSSGRVAPALHFAITTTNARTPRPGTYVTAYAHGNQYTPVASWELENLPPNVVQQRMLAGKRWVLLGPAGTPGATTFSPDAVNNESPFIGTFDLIAGLRAAHFTISRSGSATVRGVTTTHYNASSKFPFNDEGDTGQSAATVDVWVDRTGRTRRVDVVTHFPGGGDSQPSVTDYRAEYFDVGAPVAPVDPTSEGAVNGRALSQAFMCQPLPTEPPKATPECR
jgi:hypothetical protein